MRLFASERLAKIMAFLGVKEGDVIQDKRITKMVEKRRNAWRKTISARVRIPWSTTT